MTIMQPYLEEVKKNMDRAYVHLQDSLAKLHVGRVAPTMLQGLLVAHYGNVMPLHQLASINTVDARTLAIQPWEQQAIPHIEKAIAESQLGFASKNDGRQIMATLPPPSEERRKVLVKLIKAEAEKGRIVVRNVRRDYKEMVKATQKEGMSESELKRAEKKLQEFTDLYIDKINNLLALKEADILSV